MIGRQIARYRIVEQIGSGGMSVVYKGVDTALEREVAVKLLHPHLASKEDSRRRFSREARAVAKLHHPNIVEIFDCSGDDAPESFMVTEYIRGGTLRRFAENERFAPPEIAAMAVHELASALEHAHASGVIHRDLKPENVMIREDGVLKLMDFGIAKVLDRDERMTMTGALVGSPAHMAPEIIEGHDAGREADIFSLGTILYWLCTGALPFQGNNTTQTLKLILEGSFPDPRRQTPAVSDDLTAILQHCLARDPKARYPEAGALRAALAGALESVGIERPDEEFQSFFLDPPGYRARLQTRLVDRLLADAERGARASSRNHARALDALNRVLALEPDNARAKALIEATKRRRRRARGTAFAGLGVGAAAAAVAAIALFRAPRPPLPPNPSPAAPLLAAAPVSAGVPAGASPPPRADALAALPAAEAPGAAASPGGSEAPAAVAGPAPKAEDHPAHETKRPSSAATRRAAHPAESPRALASRASPAEDRTAILSVRYAPQHYARIYIDGAQVNRSAPIFEGAIPVGRHRVAIESDFCERWERDIDLPPEGMSVQASLTRKPALLSVQSSQADLGIMIEGVLHGTAGDSERDPIPVPLPEGALKGQLTVRLFRPGYKDDVRTLSFAAGQTTPMKVELEKE